MLAAMLLRHEKGPLRIPGTAAPRLTPEWGDDSARRYATAPHYIAKPRHMGWRVIGIAYRDDLLLPQFFDADPDRA
jgi:hypothetical protein